MRVGETLVCFEALYCNLLALSSDGVCSLCPISHQLDMEISVQLSLRMKDMLNTYIFIQEPLYSGPSVLGTSIFRTFCFRNLYIQDPLFFRNLYIQDPLGTSIFRTLYIYITSRCYTVARCIILVVALLVLDNCLKVFCSARQLPQ